MHFPVIITSELAVSVTRRKPLPLRRIAPAAHMGVAPCVQRPILRVANAPLPPPHATRSFGKVFLTVAFKFRLHLLRLSTEIFDEHTFSNVCSIIAHASTYYWHGVQLKITPPPPSILSIVFVKRSRWKNMLIISER